MFDKMTKTASYQILLLLIIAFYFTAVLSSTDTDTYLRLETSIFVENCIDTECLSKLLKRRKDFEKCVEPLREARKDEAGKQICCNLRKFQTCIFPMIIGYCGMDSFDTFEQEMRSLNSMCNMVTLAFNKCDERQPAPKDGLLSLEE